jgi:hypothetical protein
MKPEFDAGIKSLFALIPGVILEIKPENID